MSKSNRYMLLIGVDVYQHELEALPCCKKNAKDISRFLSKKGYTNHKGSPFIGSEIIKEENSSVYLRDAIIDFFHDAKPSHTLIFYYSGHGIPGYNDVFLATPHVDPKKPLRRGISLSEMTNCMASSKSKRVVGIIDACYSGSADLPSALLKKMSGKQTVTQSLATYDKIWTETPKTKGIHLLLSSQSYQESYAIKGSPNSLYTTYLLKGLKGVMINHDKYGDPIPGSGSINQFGNVTPDSLHEYVYHKVANEVNQVPLHKKDASGQIILARYPRLVKSTMKSEATSTQHIPIVAPIPWTELEIRPVTKNKVERLENTQNLFSELNGELRIMEQKLDELSHLFVSSSSETQLKSRKFCYNLKSIRHKLEMISSQIDSKFISEISVIKYQWGFFTSQFKNGLIVQNNYSSQISILEKKIDDIQSSIIKFVRPTLEKLQNTLRDLCNQSWGELGTRVRMDYLGGIIEDKIMFLINRIVEPS